VLCLCLLLHIPLAAEGPEANWQADVSPCLSHAELQKTGPMNVGVRFTTANPKLEEAFRSAMDFWATVLELSWHEEDTENCAIQLLDGERTLFESAPRGMVARSQLPDRSGFAGWIAFNPFVSLDKLALYRIAVHEIGHLLGLKHSADASSIMYGFDVEGPEFLDTVDLRALAERHKLRVSSTHQPVRLILLTKDIYPGEDCARQNFGNAYKLHIFSSPRSRKSRISR